MTDRSISPAHFSRRGIWHAVALALLTLPVVFASTHAAAQAAAKPDVDVLTFTNGDQLTGKVVSETGGVVTFQSDMAGKATAQVAERLLCLGAGSRNCTAHRSLPSLQRIRS